MMLTVLCGRFRDVKREFYPNCFAEGTGDRSARTRKRTGEHQTPQAVLSRPSALSSHTALRDHAEQSLHAVAWVKLDEEAANLLRYQQAYQASAQVISTANELFQSLIAAFR